MPILIYNVIHRKTYNRSYGLPASFDRQYKLLAFQKICQVTDLYSLDLSSVGLGAAWIVPYLKRILYEVVTFLCPFC